MVVKDFVIYLPLRCLLILTFVQFVQVVWDVFAGGEDGWLYYSIAIPDLLVSFEALLLKVVGIRIQKILRLINQIHIFQLSILDILFELLCEFLVRSVDFFDAAVAVRVLVQPASNLHSGNARTIRLNLGIFILKGHNVLQVAIL